MENAIHEVEEATERGEDPDAALERLRSRFHTSWSSWLTADVGATLDDIRSRGPGPGYPGPVACNAAGITYRQLEYWARTGLIEPSVSIGSRRFYSVKDIVLLKVVRKLLDVGVSVQQIRFAVPSLRATPYDELRGITFVSDGRSVFETTSEEEVIDLIRGGRGVLAVSVQAAVREVEEALRDLPGEQGDDPLPL